MENRLKLLRLPVAVVIILAMALSMIAAPSFAAAPDKERVRYLGNGKVEVEFWDDVRYKRTKVTVKDTSGKKYKARIYYRDDDELRFRIKKFKKGKTYRFTIKGLRAEYTRGYGKVKGKVKIKKAAKKSTYISKSKALSIAKNDAKRRGFTSFYATYAHRDRDDGIRVWDVTLKAKKGNYRYEFDYEINERTGRIMSRDYDRDRIYPNYYDDDYYDDYDDYYEWDD